MSFGVRCRSQNASSGYSERKSNRHHGGRRSRHPRNGTAVCSIDDRGNSTMHHDHISSRRKHHRARCFQGKQVDTILFCVAKCRRKSTAATLTQSTNKYLAREASHATSKATKNTSAVVSSPQLHSLATILLIRGLTRSLSLLITPLTG